MKTPETTDAAPLKATQSISAAMKTAHTVRTLTPAKNQRAVSRQEEMTQKTRSTSPKPMTWEDRARAARLEKDKARKKEKMAAQLEGAFETVGKIAKGALSSANDLTR